jgi:hypothetical protein
MNNARTNKNNILKRSVFFVFATIYVLRLRVMMIRMAAFHSKPVRKGRIIRGEMQT